MVRGAGLRVLGWMIWWTGSRGIEGSGFRDGSQGVAKHLSVQCFKFHISGFRFQVSGFGVLPRSSVQGGLM
jgi:hypothetical protein